MCGTGLYIQMTYVADDLSIGLQAMEDDLVVLENLCECCDLQNNQLHHQYQLSLHKQRRNVQLEQFKSKSRSWQHMLIA